MILAYAFNEIERLSVVVQQLKADRRKGERGTYLAFLRSVQRRLICQRAELHECNRTIAWLYKRLAEVESGRRDASDSRETR